MHVFAISHHCTFEVKYDALICRNRIELSEELSPSSSADKPPDISIVKVESAEGHTGGLDMFVDMPEEAMMRMKAGMDDSMENEDESDPEHDQSQDLQRDDMSNEASNVSGDQNNSWYIGQFKGQYNLHYLEQIGRAHV